MPGFVGQDSPPRSLFFFFATRANNIFEEKNHFFHD